MQKILINRCYGGFGLSVAAVLALIERKSGPNPPSIYRENLHDPSTPFRQKTFERVSSIKDVSFSGKLRGMVYWFMQIPLTEDQFNSIKEAALKDPHRAYAELHKHSEYTMRHDHGCYPDLKRDDVDLIAVVEAMGTEAASDNHAKLEIVEVPDGVKWQIEYYDGFEHVAEAHRTWPS